MDWLNRYSYSVLGSVLVVALVAIALTTPARTGAFGLAALLFGAVALIYFVLARRGHLTPAGPEKRIRRSVGAGRPVVVHFYSDYHIGSLLLRPLTAAVERTYRGRCDFVYIEMSHREADSVAEWLEAGLGDFVLIGPAGQVTDRVSRVTSAHLDALLARSATR